MKKADLEFFKEWFSDYCRTFYSDNAEDQKNFVLKEEHTLHVCENIVQIAKELSLDENRILLAETIALFHDIGRFPQYSMYKTFRDSNSVNHGLLGADTLIENKILKNLPLDEQELIIQSVKFHNAFSVPKKEKKEIIFFIQLIRDADKLDIWRVFLEYYDAPDEDRASAVSLNLPDTSDYTQEVIEVIYKKRIVSLSSIKTLNDFKLLQLSWIFDLNFKPSFQFLLKRNYINRIISHLPKTEEITNVSLFLNEFINNKIQRLEAEMVK